MKQQFIHILKEQLKDGEKEEWQNNFVEKMKALPFVKNVFIEDTQEEGILRVQIAVKEEYYYAMLSELSGITIDGEYQLISLTGNFADGKGNMKQLGKLEVRQRNRLWSNSSGKRGCTLGRAGNDSQWKPLWRKNESCKSNDSPD